MRIKLDQALRAVLSSVQRVKYVREEGGPCHSAGPSLTFAQSAVGVMQGVMWLLTSRMLLAGGII